MATSLHEMIFTAEGLSPGAARVRRFRATEGLSRIAHAEVDVELQDPAVDPRKWLHAGATLGWVRLADGVVLRRFGGIVTSMGERVSRSDRQAITVVIEPMLALLRYASDYRIFQSQTTAQIVTTLLDEANAGPYELRITGNHPTRDVCTQYGETNLAFVSRILEEEGIFHFVEYREDGPMLILADSGSAYAVVAPESTIAFRAESGMTSTEAVTRISDGARTEPAKVTLRDHDFKNPALDLTASAESKAPLGREDYDFPGFYFDPGEGKRRAEMRRDALVVEGTVIRAQSTAMSLTAGHTFTLSGAPDPALDKEWVVRDIDHVWEDSGGDVFYRNTAFLLPKDMVFRPPMVTQRPRTRGPHVARVTGPSGHEIHCDEHGRIKVTFPWDRRSTQDDKSSFWVRVSQQHTSGAVVIPRVGWEVLVDFEDGNPDRPIALGRLYNAKNVPPYPLPGQKTVSGFKSQSSPGGGGYNEIRMQDGAGGEQLHVYAQKDMNVVTANNKTEKVTTSGSQTVGADQKRTVGANETWKIGANQECKLGAAQTWSVGGSRTKSITGAEKVTIKGSRTITIGGSHTTMTPKSVSESTPASFTETVGGSAIEVAALGVATAVAGSASISVGAAKIEAVATGRGDMTLGAQASTVGGAYIQATPKDVGVNVGGAKATTVGGAWLANAGGDVELSSSSNLHITVGGLVALNAGTIVLKVGGSTVTLSGGAVVVKSSTIKLTATGPSPEVAGLIKDK
jgi:type VI secretion system secreted protein VgrG